MNLRTIFALSVLIAAGAAAADERITTSSRDSAASGVASNYYLLESASQRCVDSQVKDTAWRRALLGSWQEINKPYLLAARAYLRRRAEEIEAENGAEARRRAESKLRAVIQDVARESVDELFKDSDAAQVCQVFEGSVEDGRWDLDVLAGIEDLRAAGARYVLAGEDTLEPLTRQESP